MKANRIISGVLALTMVFGSLAMPAEVSGKAGFGSAISAEAETYGDFEYSVLDDGTVEITKYTGRDSSVTIPSEINGNKVTRIGKEAFVTLMSNLTNVTIPDSVTSIENYAFSQCAILTSVNIPDSVTNIGEAAFMDCKNLTSVNIPDSVTIIGGTAFGGCTSLTSVNIPDSVTIIKDGTFSGCTSLTSITIPDSVICIEDRAFFVSGLTNVTIPNSVKIIGDFAFSSCDNLTNVTIPVTVKKIGGTAFEGTPWIEALQEKNPLVIVNGILIDGNDASGNVVIPDDVTCIGDSAFSYCESLTSVTIPYSVTSIGYQAFYSCDNLTSITIPKSVTSIGEEAFGYYRSENPWLISDKTSDFKIKCYSGTAGEQYAKDNEFDYEIITDESDSSAKSDKNLFIYIAAGAAVVLVALGSIIVVKIKKKKNKEQE
ncbi:MAG: leucine-rich repeat domain-containing protein [Oscillospiraceae bacterium]